MRRRVGFTITEMLVSMALIMFIMVILSEAFVAGLESFRQLKAVGDMETNLRTAATILRRDLTADHFLNGSVPGSTVPLRLNNFPKGTVDGGFFAVLVSPNTFGADLVLSPPLTVPATQVQLTNITPADALSSLGPGMPVTFTGGGPAETAYTDQSYVAGANPIVLAPPGLQQAGHTKASWPAFPKPEGYDADGLPSYTDQGYVIHFTVNLNGNPYSTDDIKLKRRESYFAASLSSGGVIVGGGNSTNAPLLQSVIRPSSMLYFDTTTNTSLPLSTTPIQAALTAQLQGGVAPYDIGQPPFNDSANYYTPYAEVAYFLRDTGTTITGTQTRLYALYRRQLALLADADCQTGQTTMNGDVPTDGRPGPLFPQATANPAASIPVLAGKGANAYYHDFSWIPVYDSITNAFYMHFNSMADMQMPANRSITYWSYHQSDPKPYTPWNVPASNPNNPSPPISDFMPSIGTRGEPPNLTGADILLSNVTGMTVRVKRKYQNFIDNDFVFLGFDSVGLGGLGSVPYQVIAIEIILRVWDQKTQRTRQLTIVQNM